MDDHLYQKILEHLGHTIEIASYGQGLNVAIECIDCYVVIIDRDHPS